MTRVAVIDTGTNSTRLLVAEVVDTQVQELLRLTTVTRLGESTDESGRLAATARQRVKECLAGYAALIAQNGVAQTLILATSSVRDSQNGDVFLAELARDHSFGYKILSGEEEANLSFSGATMGLPIQERFLLFDIGGGSTEVAVGKPGRLEYARSLRLGCVRLTERFFASDPISSDELEQARVFIDSLLEQEVGIPSPQLIDRAIAVAGTATALAALDLGLTTYDRNRVHGHRLDLEAIKQLYHRLAAMTLAQRLALPTMEPGRADVIVAGALIAWRLLEYTRAIEFMVSERDIMDGAAYWMVAGREF